MRWQIVSRSAARTARWFFASYSAVLLTGCARHYRADGMVLRVNPSNHSLSISHRDIHGYMPAMNMEFAASKRQSLDKLQPGMRIKFKLAVSNRQSQVSGIEILIPVTDRVVPVPPRPELESPIPDFTLVDETNTPLTLSKLRGQVVAVDFIYTRCPLPDVCPRLSANFRRLQQRFGNRVTLLSITIDPQFDTAAVLSRYATLWKADQASWHFLTGTPAQVEAVARSFGLLYFPEEGSMMHTTETAVIGRDGSLKALVDGPRYAVSQLGDLIAAELERR